ncbi:MAG: HPr family phosphocarrier protein [Lachnospiraceae bacterium]|jgi:phosphocarrier protein|nr:HPr family phosphocarrier protein [Lachnospiraceae bacterium]MCH4030232.1 HPr family phosphocarrier protein [Lachnospiraceae bacterium]MCH4069444.1 HPr family phosphocarrier protein [Lachnospiraceae bacterium]MCH4107620.1 HPr family phosphocarrier protein [Lachnospiraceae bacterium]MCI1301529.1 HPr family phosphocarrier protein [Lachnospiraceae bacterium]
MVRRQVEIDCRSGLHLRPATAMCTEAQKYESVIRLAYGEKTANAKSVLSVLACGVGNGAEVEITAEGPDEEKALNAVVQALLESLRPDPEEGKEVTPDEGAEK